MSSTYGNWGKLFEVLNKIEPLMKKNLKIASKVVAVKMRDETKKTIVFQTQNWPELKPETVSRKGSSKILIDNADLLNSISANSIELFSYFVGVPRTVKNRNGDELVNIAAVHEYGREDETIPPRSYIQSTFEEQESFLSEIFVDAARHALNGKVYRA